MLIDPKSSGVETGCCLDRSIYARGGFEQVAKADTRLSVPIYNLTEQCPKEDLRVRRTQMDSVLFIILCFDGVVCNMYRFRLRGVSIVALG